MYVNGIWQTMFIITICQPPSSHASRKYEEGSILEIMNTKEVERLVAENEKKSARHQKQYLTDNEFVDNSLSPDEEIDIQRLKNQEMSNPRVDIEVFLRKNNKTEPYKNVELLSDLRGYNGIKLLKSSKKALYVTKKEYLRKDWCKTEPLIQKIKEPGCHTKLLINRFCYGQCNSFYIPKNPKRHYKPLPESEEKEDEDQYGPSFKSCGFCKPSKFTWVTVTLNCPTKKPQYRKKRIQRIKQCSCMTADVN